MQISISAPRTVVDAQLLLDTVDFRQISEGELQGFAGADEGDLIGEFGDFGICVMGEFTVSFFDMDDEFVDETMFRHADGEIYEMI
jgi:hypothetical protein